MAKVIEGGIITGISYESGLPILIIKECSLSKAYLNPKVIPDEYRDRLVNMKILFMEGDFPAQCPNLFFPSRVVIKGAYSQLDFQLNLG